MMDENKSPLHENNTLVLACGALAQEIIDLNDANQWNVFDIHCIPAKYHNYPDKIPDLVRKEIQKNKDKYEHIYVAFADCGTGGLLDKVIHEESVERLPGAHCYAFFTGIHKFEEIDKELGTFYLTDFFVKFFDSLFVEPYGLRKHPELIEMMFHNYSKVLYIAQKPTEELINMAKEHAKFLGLDYEFRQVGYGELESSLDEFVKRTQKVAFNQPK